MSIDGLSFYGKDYAAEFKEKWGAQVEANRKQLSSMGITVPVGQPQEKKEEEKEMKGLEVEKEQPKKEEPKKENFERQFSSKKDIKNAEKATKERFLDYGVSKGETVEDVNTEKQADKLAKNYVENLYNREQVRGTQVFMDKKAYKAAEKARKAQRRTLIAQYREEGMSRKEAKEAADSQLVENEYVRGKKTRAFVESHKDYFYDENGNFSSDKFKAKAVEYANKHTTEGEVENYHLSLKERREVAAQEGVNASVIKNIAKKSNLDYEKDDTNLYRGLYVAGMTAAGAGIGAALGASGVLASNVVATATSTATATSNATANIYDGAGNIIESATASDTATATDTATAKAKSGVNAGNGAITGATTGLGLGLATMNFIKDKGKQEAKVYEPGMPPAPQQPKPSVEPDTPPVAAPQDSNKPTTPEVNKPEPCPVETWQSEYCDHKVKRGDDWTKVTLAKVKTINGKRPDGKVLKAYVHAEKLKHGVTNFALNTMPKVGETMRVYSDFSDLLADEGIVKKHPELLLLKDAQIVLDCDGDTNGRHSGARPRVRYTPFFGQITEAVKYKQDCHDPEPVIVK